MISLNVMVGLSASLTNEKSSVPGKVVSAPSEKMDCSSTGPAPDRSRNRTGIASRFARKELVPSARMGGRTSVA